MPRALCLDDVPWSITSAALMRSIRSGSHPSGALSALLRTSGGVEQDRRSFQSVEPQLHLSTQLAVRLC